MDPALRIVDAAANRAREALRTLEDIARFLLADAALSEGLKTARHELGAIMGSLPADQTALAAWRDTPSDVGTSISTPDESVRASLGDVAIAAGKRLSEALRTLEEVCKVVGGGRAATGIEALRYRAYELERRVVTAVGGGKAPQWKVCVLVTSALCAGRSREDVTKAALTGGADCIQLREKALSDRELLSACRSLRELCTGHGASLIVNDRVDIALLAGADGVHLGRDDVAVRDARRLAGGRLLVGVSTSDAAEARVAAAEGADYCGIGPMFPSTTKIKSRLAGPGAVREYLADPAARRLPHLAIGGITPSNVGELVRAGVQGIAVSAAVCGAPDPAGACRVLRAALAGA